MKRVLSLLAVLFTLTGCGSMDSMNPVDWFADEDNSEPPAELIANVGSVPARVLWTASIGDGSDEQRVKLVPYVYEGRVFVASRNGAVRALDAASGRSIWSITTDLQISGGPGVGEDVVLVGTSNAELVAFDISNGAEKWRARLSSEVLSVPKAAAGIAVVHTIDGKLFGFDVATGKQVWIYDRSTPILTLHGSSSPVISGETVICGFANGKLTMLDLSTGELLWEVSVAAPRGRSELERMVDIDGDPMVQEGVIYVATYQGEMAAVAQDTGVVLWRRRLSSYAGLGGDWRQLYVSDEQDYVWGIDPNNGSALWKNKDLNYRKLSAPVVLGEHVVVGDFEGYLHWLSQEDGKLIGRMRVGNDSISTAPFKVGETIYVISDGGTLAAVALTER